MGLEAGFLQEGDTTRLDDEDDPVMIALRRVLLEM